MTHLARLSASAAFSVTHLLRFSTDFSHGHAREASCDAMRSHPCTRPPQPRFGCSVAAPLVGRCQFNRALNTVQCGADAILFIMRGKDDVKTRQGSGGVRWVQQSLLGFWAQPVYFSHAIPGQRIERPKQPNPPRPKKIQIVGVKRPITCVVCAVASNMFFPWDPPDPNCYGFLLKCLVNEKAGPRLAWFAAD